MERGKVLDQQIDANDLNNLRTLMKGGKVLQQQIDSNDARRIPLMSTQKDRTAV